MKHTKALLFALILAALCAFALTGCGGSAQTHPHPVTVVQKKDPTCTEVGWDAYEFCAECDYSTYVEIPALGHYLDGIVCKACGMKLTPTDGLAYTLNADGESYSVSGIGTATETDIVIADVYEGKPVTGIGAEAFYGCTGFTSIAIPASVTSIGVFAFSGCTRLTSIAIPASVTSIGYYAFSGCSALESMTLPFVGAAKDGTSNTHFGYIFGARWCSYNSTNVPSSLKTVVITDGTSIGAEAFYGCTGLTSITIPASVTSIEYYAFQGCSGLTNITIPSSVTSIGDYAFSGCSGLTSIAIPASVTSIGEGAFSGCTGLTSITVAVGNTTYHSSGNCIIETASKTLIAGCKNSVIPTDGSVTSIGDYAFSGCSGLTNITIPASVTSIGGYAFYDCSSLTSITFTGTKFEWNWIFKGYNWSNNTSGFTVTCTDGVLDKNGNMVS